MTVSTILNISRLVVGLILFIWFLTTIDLTETVSNFSLLPYWVIALWTAVNLASRMLTNEAHLICIRFLKPTQNRMPLLMLGFIRSMGNYIAPLVGTSVYVAALKDRLLLPSEKVAPFMAMQSVVILSSVSIIAIAGLFFHRQTNPLPWVILLLAFASASTVTWAIANSRWGKTISSNRNNKWIRSAFDGFSLAGCRPIKVIAIHLIQLAASVVRGSRMVLLFLAMGGLISIAEALLLIALAEGSMLIQVTPGNIGVREGTLYLAGSALGMDPAIVASVALSDRVIAVVFTGLMGALSMIFLVHGKRYV